MRRMNLGKKLVKKAIAWAMIAMMSMSTAMSSFSTLTVYAQEDAASGEEANQEETSREEDKQEAQDSEEVEVEVIENTETKEEVYSDNELVTDNENTQNDETEEAIEGEVLDHVKVETTVKDVETHYVVTDTTGEAIVGTDAEGNTVEKIEVNAEAVEVETVQVIEKVAESEEVKTDVENTGISTGTDRENSEEEDSLQNDENETAAIEEVSASDIVYGYFDEEGIFVEGTAEDGKSLGYTLTDGTYKETTTVNKVTQVDGSEVFVADEVVDVLNGEEVDGYEKKTVYYVGEGENKQEIQENELEETLAGTNYSVDEDGILSVEANETSTIKYKENELTGYKVKGYGGRMITPEEYERLSYWDKKWYNPVYEEVEKELDVTGKTITGEQIKKQGKQYIVTIDGTDYTVDKNQVSRDKWGRINGINSDTSYSIVVGGNTLTVDEKNVETKTVYQVIDESGNTVCEVDATAKDNIETQHYTKVKDMYVVKNENNEDVYFTQQEWQVMTSKEVTYEEVTKYYYVSEDKYESKEFSFTASDDKDYLLSVDFWNGDYVRLDAGKEITYVENENGDIVVSIPYLYTNDYEITENTQWIEGVYTRVVSKAEFGVSRIATLTVKYTPTLSKDTKLSFEASVVEEKVEGNGNAQGTPGIGTTEITVNNGNPVNEKASSTKYYDHVDVQAFTKVVIDGKELEATISDLAVTATVGSNKYYGHGHGHGYGRGDKNAEYTETALNMSNHTSRDPQGYYEYQSGHGLSISNQGCITISATVNYEYQGKPYSFNYVVKVYPKNDQYNTCSQKESTGFDYLITNTALQAAIQEDITKRSVKVTEKENTTVTAELGNAAENVKNEVVKAKVFVRLDGEQQLEDGTTHYDSKDYTEDLAAKYKKEIYLAYSKEGYAVHDNNLGDLTAEEKIQTKLAGIIYEQNLEVLANLYMLNEKQEQVKEYTESKEFEANISKQIEEGQKQAKKENSELNGENGTIEWTYTVGGQKVTSIEEAIDLAKTMTVALTQKNGLGVDWYVLKKESDGWHIDGVSKVPSLEIGIEGKFVPNARPSVSPSASPEATPSVSPSASPETTPSASPSASPEATPSASPSASPEATPSASPSASPEATPSVSPSASPEPTPESTPAATPDEPEDDSEDPEDDEPIEDTPIVIIEDESVALAAAPEVAPEVEDIQAAVLGANRVNESATEAAVLGARRGTEYAVLGKRRRPETGDSAAMAVWAAVLGLGAGAAVISGNRLIKDKKKNKLS